MTLTWFILLGLVVIVVGGFLLSRRDKLPPSSTPPGSVGPMANPIDPASLFISTAAEAAARSARVLPDGPSEDARDILGAPPLPPKVMVRGTGGERDYLPNPRAEWIVHVEFRDGATVSKDRILSVLGPEWLLANDSPTLYGFCPEDGRWTFLNAADVPEVYSKLQVSWRYLPLDPGLSVTFDTAERWLRALIAAASRIAPAQVRPDELPSAAERHAQALERLRNDLQDAELMIGLVAPTGEPFDGRAVWDALSSVGLKWGDGDLFHWDNPHEEAGDDSLFDVSTSTPPGYFLPEEAAEGRMKLEDLTFSMSIPRTHEPATVLEAMIRAARFAQKRLGGDLVAGEDEPLDEVALRKALESIEHKMNTAGIKPGSEEALQLF